MSRHWILRRAPLFFLGGGDLKMTQKCKSVLIWRVVVMKRLRVVKLYSKLYMRNERPTLWHKIRKSLLTQFRDSVAHLLARVESGLPLAVKYHVGNSSLLVRLRFYVSFDTKMGYIGDAFLIWSLG